jgi:proteic killer suppression protein
MIISFRDRKTEKLFNGEPVSKLNKKLAQKARRRLELLNAAQKIEDLYFPASNQFHALEGFNPKRYAIWVNKQWRISFIWEESNNAYDVYERRLSLKYNPL